MTNYCPSKIPINAGESMYFIIDDQGIVSIKSLKYIWKQEYTALFITPSVTIIICSLRQNKIGQKYPSLIAKNCLCTKQDFISKNISRFQFHPFL